MREIKTAYERERLDRIFAEVRGSGSRKHELQWDLDKARIKELEVTIKELKG